MAAKLLIAHGNTQRLKRAVEDLKGAGVDVIATPDGGDAFARFFEESPDAVITSEALPGLSGINFARMVRSQSPGTPVLVLVEPEQPLPESGEFTFLPDPLDVARLRDALPELIPDLPTPSVSAEPTSAPTSTAEVFILAALKRFQRGSHILAVLDETSIQRMARMAQHQNRGDGENVIKQGEVGDGFYLVVEGQVRVTLEERDDHEVARISAGGFFGEMALLSDSPRSASVWTAGPATLLYFPRSDFLPLLEQNPKLREVLSGVALQRTEENLWRVLFADDAVQTAFAELEGPSAEAVGVDTAVPSPERVPAEPVSLADALEPTDAEGAAPQVEPSAKSVLEEDTGLLPPRTLPPAQPRVPLGLILGASIGSAIAGAVLATVIVLLVIERGDAPASVTPSDTKETVALAQAEAPARPEAPPPEAAAPEEKPPEHVEPPAANLAEPEKEAPTAAPEPDPEKAEAPAPTADGAAATPVAPTKDKKELRKALFAAVKASQWKKALEIGKEFAAAYELDWESEFVIAEAERGAGNTEQALERYRQFVAKYPTNLYADDAQFWIAETLLTRGDKAGAKKLYEQIAANPKSNFQTSAKERLDKL